MSTERYAIDEVCDRGEQIYEEQIKHLVEPEHNGKFIVIDIESGDYEMDEEELDAFDRLKLRRSEGETYMTRIGCCAAYHMGFGGAEISD